MQRMKWIWSIQSNAESITYAFSINAVGSNPTLTAITKSFEGNNIAIYR